MRVEFYLFCCERSVLILLFELVSAGLLFACLMTWFCLYPSSHLGTSEIQALDQLFSLISPFFGLLLLLFAFLLFFVEFHSFDGPSFCSVIFASLQEFFVFGKQIVGGWIVVCLEARSA